MFKSGRRSYAAHALLGQVGFAGVAFCGSVLAARLLGPDKKGVLTAWSLVCSLLILAFAATVPVGLGREFLKGERGRFHATAIIHGGLVFVALCAVTPLCISFGAPALATLCFITVGISSGVVIQDLLLVLQASKHPWSYQLVRISTAAGLTAGLLGAFLFTSRTSPSSAQTVAWVAFAGGSLVGMVIAIYLSRKQLTRTPDRPSLMVAGRKGRGSFLTAATDWGLLRCDQLLVAVIGGPSALGIYSVAVNWSEVAQYVGHSIGQALFEDVTQTTVRQRQRFMRLTGVAAAVTAIATTLAGIVLVPTLFGLRFEQARWLVIALAPGTVARSMGYAGSQMLLGSGRGKEAALVQFITLASSVPLWLFAMDFGGIGGMAIAASCSYGIQATLTWRRVSGQSTPTSSLAEKAAEIAQ